MENGQTAYAIAPLDNKWLRLIVEDVEGKWNDKALKPSFGNVEVLSHSLIKRVDDDD
jgi:hypothetical protein